MMNHTKRLKILVVTALVAVFAAGPFASFAADQQKPKQKPKPYTLKTCLVSDEKLGSMGEPYVFTHEDKEIKLCCKGCLKDFNKDTKKFIKKMSEAEAKAKKAEKKG